ncbi:hypothetical protein QUF72_08525 [Desulfobacterales bacterium HSG2]|nr:hypothetical protein [Desulfobacterales bacterium HSG2]
MMNDNEKKIKALKEENPFTSSSVGDPWEDKYPDVRSINERAFKEIAQLIDQKTKSPSLPCAGLVFGEVGSGKTHLVGRILKYGRQTDFPFSFAYVQPIEDTEQTYRYLLREVIVNLCYPINPSSDVTQLDIILERIFKEVSEQSSQTFRNSGIRRLKNLKIRGLNEWRTEFRDSSVPQFLSSSFKDLSRMVRDVMRKGPLSPEEIEKRAISFIRVKFPDIPKAFLKVLFQYQSPDKRSAAMEWLRGAAIDDEDAALLQVPSRLRYSPSLSEQESRNILNYLGVLLLHYGQPLVICFDRLENYDTDEKIRSLGKMVEFLVDKVKAMLPLVFVRGQQWEEKFTKKLNQQVITRLRTNEFQLKGCNDNQALGIVRTRLASVYGNPKFGIRNPNLQKEDDLSPFDKEKLTSTFKMRLHSPRQVIMLANQRLKQILYPDAEPVEAVFPLDKLQDEFEHQYTLIRADFNRYQPDRSRLKRALELYLRHNSPESGFELESLSQSEDKYVDIRCRIRAAAQTSEVSHLDAVFIIDTELNNSYVRASVKRGIDFLEKDGNGKAFYIRDARCAIPPPPKWKVTNEMLGKFREIGGKFISLEEAQAARWYALALLNYAVKEGDVTIVEANNRTRPVSQEELAAFVQEKIHNSRACPNFQHISEILRGQRGQGREEGRQSERATDNGPTDNGPTDNGPTRQLELATDNGPTDNGPTRQLELATDNGPTRQWELATDNGPTDNGTTRQLELATDQGTNGQRTNKAVGTGNGQRTKGQRTNIPTDNGPTDN